MERASLRHGWNRRRARRRRRVRGSLRNRYPQLCSKSDWPRNERQPCDIEYTFPCSWSLAMDKKWFFFASTHKRDRSACPHCDSGDRDTLSATDEALENKSSEACPPPLCENCGYSQIATSYWCLAKHSPTMDEKSSHFKGNKFFF